MRTDNNSIDRDATDEFAAFAGMLFWWFGGAIAMGVAAVLSLLILDNYGYPPETVVASITETARNILTAFF